MGLEHHHPTLRMLWGHGGRSKIKIIEKYAMDLDATAEYVTHPCTGRTPVLESLDEGETIHNPGLLMSNVMEEGADSRDVVELFAISQDEMSNKEEYSKTSRVNGNK